MQTIRLRIDDKIYDRLIGVLSKFSKDEVEIISENPTFLENQRSLNMELDEIIQGKAKFVDLNEVEERLETIIARNENKI